MELSCSSYDQFEQSFSELEADFSSAEFWLKMSNHILWDFLPNQTCAKDTTGSEQHLSLNLDELFPFNDSDSSQQHLSLSFDDFFPFIDTEEGIKDENDPHNDSISFGFDQPSMREESQDLQGRASVKTLEDCSATDYGSLTLRLSSDISQIGQSGDEDVDKFISERLMVPKTSRTTNKAPHVSVGLACSDPTMTKHGMSGMRPCEDASQITPTVIIEISDDEEESTTSDGVQSLGDSKREKPMETSQKRKRSLDGNAKSKRRKPSYNQSGETIHHSKVVLDRDAEVLIRLIEGQATLRTGKKPTSFQVKWDRRAKEYRASTPNGPLTFKDPCDFEWISVTIRINGDGQGIVLDREDDFWTGMDTEAEIKFSNDQIETLLCCPDDQHKTTWNFV